jgi:hypothetical protein
VKLPGNLAEAFSCVALSAVPYMIAAGVAQLSAGTAWLTVSVTVAVA